MNKAILFIFLSSIIISCISKKEMPIESNYAIIETTHGNIYIKLYDDTPIHKQNFIKLVNNGAYNKSYFHRVIDKFMIQGGKVTNSLVSDSLYSNELMPEISKNIFHKKGSLCAARRADSENPKKLSSGNEFYIVEGEVFDDENLSIMKKRKKNFQPSLEQEELYKTIGGTPHLDMDYTVFGEVIYGMEVVDKISNVKCINTSPVDTVYFNIKMIEEKSINKYLKK